LTGKTLSKIIFGYDKA